MSRPGRGCYTDRDLAWCCGDGEGGDGSRWCAGSGCWRKRLEGEKVSCRLTLVGCFQSSSCCCCVVVVVVEEEEEEFPLCNLSLKSERQKKLNQMCNRLW